MGFNITRSNGIVTQIWEDNEANWDFFLGGMSKDVQWKNIKEKHLSPKVFSTYDDAKYHLDTRKKFLKTVMQREEYQWAYHIIREGDYELCNSQT